MLDNPIGYETELHALIDAIHGRTKAVGFGTRQAMAVSGQSYVTFAVVVEKGTDVAEAIGMMQDKIEAHIDRVIKKQMPDVSDSDVLYAYWRKLPDVETNDEGEQKIRARFLASFKPDDGVFTTDCKVVFDAVNYKLVPVEAEVDEVEEENWPDETIKYEDEFMTSDEAVETEEPPQFIMDEPCLPAEEPAEDSEQTTISERKEKAAARAFEGAFQPGEWCEVGPNWVPKSGHIGPLPLTIGQAIDSISDILKRIEGGDIDDQDMVLEIVGDIRRNRVRRVKT